MQTLTRLTTRVLFPGFINVAGKANKGLRENRNRVLQTWDPLFWQSLYINIHQLSKKELVSYSLDLESIH